MCEDARAYIHTYIHTYIHVCVAMCITRMLFIMSIALRDPDDDFLFLYF